METTLTELLHHVPAFVRRPDGEILYWTEGCTELFCHSREQAVGRPADDLLKTQYSEPLDAIAAKLAATGEWSGRLKRTRADGGEIWTFSVWRRRRAAQPASWIIVEQDTDITKLVELEERNELLGRELQHRVKNMLAIVQALARMSFRDAPAEQRKIFDERIQALSHAANILQHASWKEADLGAMITETLRSLGARERIRIDGPDVTICSHHATGFALALHELCTNAMKHGALSVPTGRVQLTWDVDPDGPNMIRVRWQEMDGPRVSEPSRTGFGRKLITQAISGRDCSVDLRFEADGVVCDLTLARSAGVPETVGGL